MNTTYIHTVTELTRQIKFLLETNIPPLWIQGEMSNVTRHSSGHLYFSLKDENSQLRCVMWRREAASLAFVPQNGMLALARGAVTVYERGGQYQLSVIQLQPAGVGELQVAFEQLKRRLSQDGLFDSAHKKAPPAFPERVGVVTSPTGAAIRDIVHVIRRRFPSTAIVLSPVRVQGEGAASEIARAIEEFNEYGQVDVLIVGRGGGSMEDLWAFNEESVARAIYASRIPVISAVGHEIDFTIADLVADLRAPTPSAAAEMVVKDRAELRLTVETLVGRLVSVAERTVEGRRRAVVNVRRRYGFRRPEDLINQYRQQTDGLRGDLVRAFASFLQLQRKSCTALAGRLQGLSPQAVLSRGYSICQRLPDLKLITDAKALKASDRIEVTFGRGLIEGTVDRVEG